MPTVIFIHILSRHTRMVETEHHLGFFRSQLSFEYFITFEVTMDEWELHSYVSKLVAANEIMSRHRGCNLFFYVITWHGPIQRSQTFVNSFTNTQLVLSK